MDDLFIMGAGGASREITDLVDDINADTPRWRLCGIFDDDSALASRTVNGIPVIGPIPPEAPRGGFWIIGIASWRNRAARCRIAERLGDRVATLLHPTAQVSPWAAVGEGTVVRRLAVVGPQASVGRHVMLSAMTPQGITTDSSDSTSSWIGSNIERPVAGVQGPRHHLPPGV